jgi:alpha-beta hydrolase superfamily lysophospholipase
LVFLTRIFPAGSSAGPVPPAFRSRAAGIGRKAAAVIRKLCLPLCLLALTGCSNLMFQPTGVRYSDPAAHGIQLEDLFIESSDGVVLHGWHLPAQGTTRGSVLFLHGNGENISSHVGSVYWLPAYGYEVFLFDYRGYGRSGGSAELDGVMRDAVNMITWARDHAAAGSHGLTILGHSMGGSIAIYALAELPDRHGLNALVSVDAFGDYRQITRDALSGHWLTWAFQWPLSLTISNRYRPADYIGRLSPLPVFILHSEDDKIVPAAHADTLFQAAGQPRFRLYLRGGHNQILALGANRELLLEVLAGLNTPSHAPVAQAVGYRQ